jgi:hypothetical protein
MSNGDKPNIATWLPAIAAIAGVGAAVLYALIRFAYERFYDVFGVSPEQVGIDSTRVLSQSAFGLLVFAFLTTVFYGIFALFMIRGNRTLSSTAKRRTLLIALALGALGVLLPIIKAWGDAVDAAECAAGSDGQSVRSLRFNLGGVTGTVVGVRADRASVTWIGDETAPAGIEDGPAVILGESDGRLFIYLPARETTLDVPAADVVAAIDPTTPRYRPSKGCQPVPA